MFGIMGRSWLAATFCLLLLASCGIEAAHTKSSSSTLTPSSEPAVLSASTRGLLPEGHDTLKEDNSVRAIGTHSDGQLLVRPASKADVAYLGAPSCYGLETDLRWTGDYEAVWERRSDGAEDIVMSFPVNFEIVQREEAPVEMKKFSLEGSDLFAYVPRYTDCHALETYFFEVSKGEAFPVSFQMDSAQIWSSIGQLPLHPFRISGGELVLTGGYGAGQDDLNVYHFRYDTGTRLMILQKTERIRPDAILK